MTNSSITFKYKQFFNIIEGVIIKYLILLLILLVGCSDKGVLVTGMDYPNEINAKSQRTVNFLVYVQNQGNKECTINNIYSEDFWKPDSPGLTTNMNRELNFVLAPGESRILSAAGYVWDADAVQTHVKEFTININVGPSPGCEEQTFTRSGAIAVKV